MFGFGVLIVGSSTPIDILPFRGPRDPINSDVLAQKFSTHMADTPLTVGQPLLFRFEQLLLAVTVKSLSGTFHKFHQRLLKLTLPRSPVPFELTHLFTSKN